MSSYQLHDNIMGLVGGGGGGLKVLHELSNSVLSSHLQLQFIVADFK